MLVAFVEVVFCLNLGCELAVESVVHHPPWNTLRNHKWDSVLMETVRLKWLKHWFEKRFLAEVWQGKKKKNWSHEMKKKSLNLLAHKKHSPKWWWPRRCCLDYRGQWRPEAVRSSIIKDTSLEYEIKLKTQEKLTHWAAPLFCTECHSLWWWSPSRRTERTSPPSLTPSPSCRLSWSFWWTARTRGRFRGRRKVGQLGSLGSTNHVPEGGAGALAGCVVFQNGCVVDQFPNIVTGDETFVHHQHQKRENCCGGSLVLKMVFEKLTFVLKLFNRQVLNALKGIKISGAKSIPTFSPLYKWKCTTDGLRFDKLH